MKKTIQILVGIIAFAFLIVIIKKNFFAVENNYEKGIEFINKKEFEKSIQYLKIADFQKYPEAYFALGEAYLRTDQYDKALNNFIKTYELNVLNSNDDNYSYLVNMIGVLYLYKDVKKSRFFLEKAHKLGNLNSKNNLQILDSLEQVQKNATDINQ